jgi:hypothetical protein
MVVGVYRNNHTLSTLSRPASLGDVDLESGYDVALHGLQLGVVEVTLVLDLPLEPSDRIPSLPRFELPFRKKLRGKSG